MTTSTTTPTIITTPEGDAMGVVRDAIAAGESVRGVAPVALRVRLNSEVNPADPDSWTQREGVEVEVVPDPLFAALMEAIGGRAHGSRTWVFGIGRESDPKPIAALCEVLPMAFVTTKTAGMKSYEDGNPFRLGGLWSHALAVEELLNDAGAVGTKAVSLALAAGVDFSPKGGTRSPGLAVMLHVAGASLYVRVVVERESFGTSVYEHRSGRWSPTPAVFRQLAIDRRPDPTKMAVSDLVGLVNYFTNADYQVGGRVIDAEGTGRVAALLAATPGTLLLTDSPARPAAGSVWRGPESYNPNFGYGGIFAGTDLRNVLSLAAEECTPVGISPLLRDVLAMEDAMEDPPAVPGLRPYQSEAVAALVATERGMVNACAPGLGKTVMTLAAWRQRAEGAAEWRGMVVCPASLRTQWRTETERFFPEAEVRVLTSGKDAAAFAAELADDERVPTAPLVVVASYEVASRNAEALAVAGWDALCVDEATVLRNKGTKRSKGLWELRQAARVAVALTGTPVDKSLNDLGALLEWSRNDEDLFRFRTLSREFRKVTTDDYYRKQFVAAMGPVMFRRDRSEVSDELPEVTTEVVLLDPSDAERNLADAARNELRRIYYGLVKALDEREAEGADADEIADARKTLASSRGAMLGGVTLARMASSDPEALMVSEAAGTALLEADGLVTKAVAGGSTKRTHIAALAAELVDAGEAVLIFTDFARVADLLADAITAHGATVGKVVGGQSMKDRDAAVEGFQSGDIDVLVCSSTGNEGLNLQRATVLVHYDLPWLPSQVIQRVARAVRLGSMNPHLSVLIPIMAGTIEERVAGVLIPRAATALAALDTSRGKAASETDIGMALGGLVGAVSADEVGESLMEVARAILAD